MDARKCGLQWAARAKNSRFSVERIGESQRATALLMCVSSVVSRVCHIDVATVLPGRERGPEPGCRCCLVAFRPPVLYWEDVCCGLERWTHRRMMHTRLGTRLTAHAAPRWHGSWHGVAHPAATLQALCPTAGLGCCANRGKGEVSKLRAMDGSCPLLEGRTVSQSIRASAAWTCQRPSQPTGQWDASLSGCFVYFGPRS